MTVEEQIRANAELTISMLREVSPVPDFGYNAESVEWLQGYIEHARTQPEFSSDGSKLEHLVSNLGSYLGQCVIVCFGGEWQLLDGGWAIAFDAANAVFPFNKVRKQFKNGIEGGDGIYGWFTMIPAVFFRKT
jgi:hypothetical protein